MILSYFCVDVKLGFVDRQWRWLSCVMLRRVVWYKLIDVSEVFTASNIRADIFILNAVR
jgi:hypothetical protein